MCDWKAVVAEKCALDELFGESQDYRGQITRVGEELPLESVSPALPNAAIIAAGRRRFYFVLA
jgi:hypothetical protein